MRIVARLLLVTALLASAGLVVGTGSAGAGSSDADFPGLSCRTVIGGAITVDANYDVSVAISADDSVQSGTAAGYAVSVTGLTNAGFADFNGGKARVTLGVGGGEVVSPTVDIPNTGKNQPILIPVIEGLTDPLEETTTIAVLRVQYWNSVANSRCTFPSDSTAEVAVLVENGGGSELPATTTTVGVTPSAPTYPGPVEVTANVATDSAPASGGTVEFFDGVEASAPSLGTAPLSAGAASIAGVELGGGSHQILARFSGTDTLAPSQGVHTFTVAKAAQSIEFAQLPDAIEGDAPTTLTATASSGLAVAYTAAGACSVSGSTLELTGMGNCQVTASQAGDVNFLAAADVVRSFEIAEATTPGGGDPGPGDPGDGGGSTDATQKSVTAAVPYRCVVSFPSLETDLVSTQTLTVKLTAPDIATVASQYTVYMDVTPGIRTDAEIPAGAITNMTSQIKVAAPGTPSALITKHPSNASTVPSGGYVAVPRSTGKVTASGTAGQKVAISPGAIVMPTKAQTPGAAGGSVTCTPSGSASISTVLTDQQVNQDTTAPAPPPAQQTPAAPASAAPPAQSAPATAAVIKTGSTAVLAQVLENSAQVTFECKIYVGSNLVTTQQDTQTVTVRTVDKVAPGGTLAFQMSVSPGPKTGPVALPNGVENMQVGAAIGGGASPANVAMNAGTLSAPVGTNSNVVVPTMSGSVQVTGAAGSSITITAADMSFETTRPPSRTQCTALGAPVITTTEIVEGVQVASETAARLASTGNSREWLAPVAVAQLLVGSGIVLLLRRRRALAAR